MQMESQEFQTGKPGYFGSVLLVVFFIYPRKVAQSANLLISRLLSFLAILEKPSVASAISLTPYNYRDTGFSLLSLAFLCVALNLVSVNYLSFTGTPRMWHLVCLCIRHGPLTAAWMCFETEGR